jgi:hypothetical protein
VTGVDLVEFIRARLDEIERAARYAGGTGGWAIGDCVDAEDGGTEWLIVEGGYPVARVRGNMRTGHIALNDPAYVLADIAAKRRMLDWAVALLETLPNDPASALMFQQAGDELLHLLAAPFAEGEHDARHR